MKRQRGPKPTREAEKWDWELTARERDVIRRALDKGREPALAMQEHAIRQGIRQRLARQDQYALEDRETASWVYQRALDAMRIAEALQRPGAQERVTTALHYLLDGPDDFRQQLGRAPPENLVRRLAASFAEACRSGFNEDIDDLAEASALALLEAARVAREP